jgi:hypothetical protein
MEWQNIISAVLAGGIAGQLVTILLGNRLNEKRDYRKWIITERYKLFCEFLTTVTNIPRTEEEINDWTYKIRNVSLKIHILYDYGAAPKDFSEAIEEIFQLAKQKKKGTEDDMWSNSLRESVKEVRKCMSIYLKYK